MCSIATVRCRVAALGLALCLGSVSVASAQAQAHDHPAPAEQPSAPAPRPRATAESRARFTMAPPVASAAPNIDGALTEPAWTTAAVVTEFTQQEPVDGQPATERTEVRVMYDTHNLYIGVHAFDSAPDRIVATEMRRDSSRLFDEDNFQVILDTFRDSRNGYMFVTNPLGAKLEQQIFEEGGGNARGSASNINKDWNGVWDAAAKRTADGWVAEIAIPVVTVRSPAVPVQNWGINFMRNIRRKNEMVYWSPIPKPYSLTQVSLAGTVTGMSGMTRGLDVRVKPYLLGGVRRDQKATTVTSNGIHEAGLDVKYGFGSGMTLDATLNTDFAQAEVDEQQVNLTRFSLYFPEKRDFFLENSGQFTVSNQGLERLMDLFFSRRIGLSETGQPIGIIGGSRLTGKIGRNNVAVMDIQTEAYNGKPSNNFLVARYSHDIGRRSKIGGLFINKEARGSALFNRTIAADGTWAPTRSFSWQTIIAKTATPGVEKEQQAFHTRALFMNNKWQTYAEYTDIDNHFNDEVGFVPRVGIHQTKVHLERDPRPGGRIRMFEPMVNVIYITDQNNRLLTRRIHQMIGTRFQNGAYLNLWWNRWLDVLDKPFAIQPTVKIPTGTYRYNEFMLLLNSNPARRIYERASFSPQTFYTGHRKDTNLTLGVRASSRAGAELAYTRNDVDLPWGNFVVNLAIMTLDFTISPRMTVRSLSQYNSYAKQFTTSARFNYVYRPGSDIYVTYDELQVDAAGRPTTVRNRQLAVKSTFLLSR